MGFSGDDSLVVLAIDTTAGPTSGVVDLRSGRMIWRSGPAAYCPKNGAACTSGPEEVASFIAQPDGRSFALAYMGAHIRPSLEQAICSGTL